MAKVKVEGQVVFATAAGKFPRPFEEELDINVDMANKFRGGMRSYILRKALPAHFSKEMGFCRIHLSKPVSVNGKPFEDGVSYSEDGKPVPVKAKAAPKKDAPKKAAAKDVFDEE